MKQVDEIRCPIRFMDTVRKACVYKIHNVQIKSPIYLDTQMSECYKIRKFSVAKLVSCYQLISLHLGDIRLQYMDQIKMNQKCIRYNLDQNASH